MDVRTKVVLWSVGLFVFVVLIIFLLIGIVRDPIPQDGLSPIDIDSTGSVTIGDTNIIGGGDDLAQQDEERVIATVTFSDIVDPFKEVDAAKIGTLPEGQIAYKVRLTSSWSKLTHPNFVPVGPHLSPMVGWTHEVRNVVFASGGIASDGMEEMAETGGTAPLIEEITALGDQGLIGDLKVGSVFFTPGEQEFIIILSEDKPMISVVSMIAPSPDWFITAHNINLRSEGNWVSYRQVGGVLYDAGTDSGTRFVSVNRDTQPREPIALFPSAPENPIGTFEFIRL